MKTKKNDSIHHSGNGHPIQGDADNPLEKRNSSADFLESLPQPVFELGADRLVTYANRAALDMLELAAADIAVGLDALAVIAPEYKESVGDAFVRVIQGEVLTDFEAIFCAKSGRTFPGAVYCRQISADGQIRIRGLITDITERKAAENLLQLQKDLNQELSQAADIKEAFDLVLKSVSQLEHVDCGGVYLVEKSGGLRLVSHFKVSPEFVQAASYCEADSPRTLAAMLGKPVYVNTTEELGIPDDDMQREGLRALAMIPIVFDDKVQAVMNVAAHSVYEFPPSTRYALESIALRLGSIVCRLKALGALHESEERFRTMAEQMMDVLFTTDADGILTYISPSAKQVFGWPSHQMTGKPFIEFLPDEEIHKAMFAFQSSLTTGVRTKRLALNMKRRDGSIFLGELSGSPATVQGNQAGTVGLIRNVSGRKEAEEELRVSRDRLKMAIEGGNVGLWDWDLRTNQIYFSSEWKKQIGYRDDEIAGKYEEWEGRLHPEDRGATLSSLKASLAPPWPPYQVEFRIRHKDGSYRWIMAQGSLQFDEQGKPVRIFGSNVDITARKRSEEALLKSRRELRQTLDATTDGIWSWNFQSGQLWFSPRYYTMLGYKPGEFPASFENWRNLIHPNDLDTALRVAEKYRKTKPDTYENEFRLRTKNGDYCWIRARARVAERDQRGEAILLIGNHEDVTERKQAAQVLAESEERHRTVVSSVSEGMILQESGGKILTWNKAAEKIFGIKAEEVVGKPLIGRNWKTYHENGTDFPAEEHPSHRTLQTGQSCHDVIMGVRHAITNQLSWISINTNPVFEKGNPKLTAVAVSFADITARKEAEDALRASRLHLSNAIRLAKLGDWEYDVVNDLFIFNDDFYAMFRTTAEEVGGYALSSSEYAKRFVHPEDAPLVADEVRKAIESPDPHFSRQLEHRMNYANGEIGWIAVRFQIIKDNTGQTIRTYGINQDITEIKQAEAALRESEKHYHQLFDSMISGFALHEIILDSEGKSCDYRFLEVNSAFERLTGLKAEDIIGRTVRDVMPGTESYWIETYGRVAINAETARFENYSCELDKYYEVTAYSPVPGQFATIFQDITERKRAEEALRQREEQLRILFDNLTIGVYRTTPDGKILSANPALLGILGYASLAELQLRNLEDEGFHPSYPRSHFKNLLKKDGEIRGLESAWTRHDGATIFIRENARIVRGENGETLCYEGTAEDITEHKEDEKALRVSEERFKQVAESAGEWIWEVDAEGLYTYSSPVSEKILGYTPEELVGKLRFYDLFTPEVREELKAAVLATFAQKSSIQRLVNPNLHKNGSIVILETSGVPILDDEGNLFGYRGTDTDITERKRAEKEREQLESQLRRAQKMEAIGTLAGGIAHDFNNILTPIMAYTEMAVETLPPETPTRSDLEHVIEAANRAKDLVRQILTFSRQTEQARFAMSLAPIIKETLKLLRASLPSTIIMHENIRPHAGEVVADPSQMHQVLMNLCTNAAWAMRDKGGELFVGLEDFTVDYEFARGHPHLHEGSYVRLSVADTGCGMNSEILSRVFEPFFTTKPTGEGTGLGLPVVHGIITGNGGDIHVTSEPDKGTSFDIYLPKATETAQALRPAADTVCHGSEHILLIDDEPEIARVGQRVLENYGYHVATRTSSIDALEAFTANPNRFDLIVTDQTMPHMTGLQLTKEIRALRPEIPVIFITGFSNQVDEQTMQSLGIEAVLMKPLVAADLARVVRVVLDTDTAALRSPSDSS